MKKQILVAVDRIYLAALDNDVFGFAEVTIADMLTHLHATYGTITRAELETNRASISTLWTPSEPIKTLWERLREVQRVATAGADPLTNATLMDLTFLLFESTGVFPLACDLWRNRAVANRTLREFRIFFTAENKERLCKLTTTTSGFHSANTAAQVPPPPPPSDTAAAAPRAPTKVKPTVPPMPYTASTPAKPNPAPVPATPAITTNDGLTMYYCWTHGLGLNRTHTSATCSNPADGHCSNATVKNMQGGNNTIMVNRRCPKPE